MFEAGSSAVGSYGRRGPLPSSSVSVGVSICSASLTPEVQRGGDPAHVLDLGIEVHRSAANEALPGGDRGG